MLTTTGSGNAAPPTDRRPALRLTRDATRVPQAKTPVAGRSRQRLQVVHLLQVAVTDVAPSFVTFPDQVHIAGFLDLLCGVAERRTPLQASVPVRRTPAFQQVHGRFVARAAAAIDVIGLAIALTGTRIDSHNFQR